MDVFDFIIFVEWKLRIGGFEATETDIFSKKSGCLGWIHHKYRKFGYDVIQLLVGMISHILVSVLASTWQA